LTVQGIVSNNWRTILARVYSRDVTQVQKEIVRFKIGEGGSSGGLPITPDATFVDVQGEGAPLANGGTCEFTNGSTLVEGSGTNFQTDVSAGDWIKPGPEPALVSPNYSAGEPGTEEDGWGEVLSVHPTLQQITLTASYIGTTHPFSENRPCHKASEPLYVFRKTLVVGDVLFDSVLPAITELTATVLGGEANSDQLGNTPDFYELGFFDDDGVMVGYVTFDRQQKVSGVQLVTIADLIF